MFSRQIEMDSAFPQMIVLLTLVKPGLELVVRVKFQSLYFLDPKLELVALSLKLRIIILLLIYGSSSQEDGQVGGRH